MCVCVFMLKNAYLFCACTLLHMYALYIDQSRRRSRVECAEKCIIISANVCVCDVNSAGLMAAIPCPDVYVSVCMFIAPLFHMIFRVHV